MQTIVAGSQAYVPMQALHKQCPWPPKPSAHLSDAMQADIAARTTAMPDITVNGVRHNLDADPAMPLLWALRDLLALRGTKFGCGIGACGACTVHLDGQAVRSCITTLEDAAGKQVLTIEGLGMHGENMVQRAWKAANVPQCGYCQPGQIMQAAALLKQTPKPTEQQIVDAMSGNICRCGTDQRIKAAINAAAAEAA
jgi:isoquinoline 1-oxidoreductase subunit alpha